jgi:uncharacterized protein YjiS (DUF1127 family)
MIMRTTQQATDRVFSDVWMVLMTTMTRAVNQIKTVVQTLRNRSLAKRLTELDDYLLNDIGILRSELEGELLQEKYLQDPTLKLAHYASARVKKQVSHLSMG